MSEQPLSHNGDEEFNAAPASAGFTERLDSLTEEELENRAKALRAGLDEFDLDSDDLTLLESEAEWGSTPSVPSRAAGFGNRRPTKCWKVSVGEPNSWAP